MKLKTLAICVLFAAAAALLSAGDRAEFMNLGFSESPRVFIYGQYGIDEQGLYEYAEIGAVDLLPGSAALALPTEPGRVQGIRGQYPIALPAAQSGLSAMLMQLREFLTINPVDHDFTRTGVPLYIRTPGTEPTDIVSFSNPVTGDSYTLSLTKRPRTRTPGVSVAVAATIFRTSPDGIRTRYDAGSLTRPLVNVYDVRLNEVLADPTGEYLVVVLQTNQTRETGAIDIRYHVLGTRLSIR